MKSGSEFGGGGGEEKGGQLRRPEDQYLESLLPMTEVREACAKPREAYVQANILSEKAWRELYLRPTKLSVDEYKSLPEYATFRTAQSAKEQASWEYREAFFDFARKTNRPGASIDDWSAAFEAEFEAAEDEAKRLAAKA